MDGELKVCCAMGAHLWAVGLWVVGREEMVMRAGGVLLCVSCFGFLGFVAVTVRRVGCPGCWDAGNPGVFISVTEKKSRDRGFSLAVFRAFVSWRKLRMETEGGLGGSHHGGTFNPRVEMWIPSTYTFSISIGTPAVDR